MKPNDLLKTVIRVFVVLSIVIMPIVSVYARGEESILEEEGAYDGFILGFEHIPGLDDAVDSFGEVSPIDIELGFTLVSAYIWRGQRNGNDVSWQPYVTISPDFEPEGFGDISFTYWANVTHDHPGSNYMEQDFSVDYSVDIKEYGSISAGYIYYDFPHVEDSNAESGQEIYFGASANILLNPSFTWYHDFDAGSGEWLEFGISHDFDLTAFTLATYATLGYNHGQWGADSQLSVLDFGASIPIPLGKHMTIEPFLSYIKELDDDGTGLINDELYGGFNYSISF